MSPLIQIGINAVDDTAAGFASICAAVSSYAALIGDKNMTTSVAFWTSEVSIGDVVAAAKHVLDDHDRDRGTAPEPDEHTPYEDAVADLVHRVAVNYAQWSGGPVPSLTDVIDAIEQETGRQLHQPCPTHSPVRCTVVAGQWQCPVDGESFITTPEECV